MASKLDWLDTGLRVLCQDGAPALTIERLCTELDLTKGSFYHHFKGMAGFKTDLLAHFENQHTSRFIDATESGGGSARVRIERLLNLVLDDKNHNAGLEIAVRAWALQDAEVRALQERVDRLRVNYLRDLWQAMGGTPEESAPMARLLYSILIGSQQMFPPASVDELRRVYGLALRLAPHDLDEEDPR